MTFLKMNETNLKLRSRFLLKGLCCSETLHYKCITMECKRLEECLHSALSVLGKFGMRIATGSSAEGTAIISDDYRTRLHSSNPNYVSDVDVMKVMCGVRVIDEGDILPERFDNHMYLRAERGEHTTDGFRKLRIIHIPSFYPKRQYYEEVQAKAILKLVEHGYLSSKTKMTLPAGLRTQGPSQVVNIDDDMVSCFYVKTWPQEAQPWFARGEHWPDKQLKTKIRNIGYLLVSIGNRKSQESDLEWRCSFSIAEKILFQSLTSIQRCTFILFKVLLKEYLPPDVNTDGEKKLFTTYHSKTVFLWCLEDSQIKWEPEDMMVNIDHMFDQLMRWINGQHFPHYFIPSVNLVDGRKLDARKKALLFSISEIRNDLFNKILQSEYTRGQTLCNKIESTGNSRLVFKYYKEYLLSYIAGVAQRMMCSDVICRIIILFNSQSYFPSCHSELVELLISDKLDVDLQLKYLYSAMYPGPIHDKVLMEVMPGLINQYRGCMHLVKYCMAARDGCQLTDVLHTAKSLLKGTLHVDPCSGHVKLAILYIATDDFVPVMSMLDEAEYKFQSIRKNMVTSNLREPNGLEVDESIFIQEVFQKWVEGQVTSDFVITWPEYITLPDLFQFELILGLINQNITGLGFIQSLNLKAPCCNYIILCCPTLSMIKLLKFVCAFNSGRYSTSDLDNLVADLISSSLSIVRYRIYIVFNMATWCYVKLKKYKLAARMMTVAIESSKETKSQDRCAFSRHFLAYVIAQCLVKDHRVLVYQRDNVWSREAETLWPDDRKPQSFQKVIKELDF